MKPETIKIDDVEYVRKGVEQDVKGDLKIVILQRGWVMVGKLERNGSDCVLHNASVIRQWGTTKGLGEIAFGGPTSKTVLDKCYGEVQFDYLTVISCIACKEASWAGKL